MNRERLTYDFLENSDLSVTEQMYDAIRRRTMLWVCSVFWRKQVIKTVLTSHDGMKA